MSETKHHKQKIRKYLDAVRQDPNHRNYWYAYKKIQQLELKSSIDPKISIKIALLSSFTIDPLATYLDIDSRLINLEPQVYIGPFNQYRQAILDDNSKLNRENFDLIIFNIDLRSIMTKGFVENYPQLNSDDINAEMENIIVNISTTLENLTRNKDCLILFSNFIVPTFSPFGILESKQAIGYQEFYRKINEKLLHKFKDNNQIRIVDLDLITSKFGKSRITNHAMYYRGSILFSDEFLPVLSNHYMGYVKALRNRNRKAIVLDLDNTLWGGIIGEDGMDGIKLNNNYPGKEFVEFQKLLLTYYNRGIILAANSKNNFDDAMEVIREHPFMVLREKHFAALRINWQDKVQNLIEIAEELNIGLDSLVFVDDNPVERERVKQSLPQVKVVDMPESSSEYVATFEELNDFNSLSLTKEDLKRGEMYVARRQRESLKQNVQSMESFIESLEIKAIIREADEFALPRVTSLVNRTNQFNLMTKRYTETQIQKYHQDPQKKIYTLQVKDKFGDEGIVGIAMVDITNDHWKLDNFMMSCRVIGRKIETTFISKIINDALKSNAAKLSGYYIPSKKNKLVQNFYKDHNFTKVRAEEDNSSEWEFVLEEELKYPDFIGVIEDE